MRKWARKVAHYKMKKAGYVHINKGYKGVGDSYFSKHWREFV